MLQAQLRRPSIDRALQVLQQVLQVVLQEVLQERLQEVLHWNLMLQALTRGSAIDRHCQALLLQLALQLLLQQMLNSLLQ